MQFALHVHPEGHVQAHARNPKGEMLVYQTFWDDGLSLRKHQKIEVFTWRDDAARRTFHTDTKRRGYTKVCTFATQCVRPDSNAERLRNLLQLLDRSRLEHIAWNGIDTRTSRAINAMYSFLLDPAQQKTGYATLTLFLGAAPSPHFNF